MRVTIDAPLVVANTSSFGETWVVASGGVGATGLNARGGMTISDGDFNPERIQLEDGLLSPGYVPAHTQGDRLADVTGIMTYGFNSPELLVTGGVTVTSDVTLGREATALEGDRDHLTVGSYNVENLDPTDPQSKFDLLASDIVYSLGAPDVVALQEVQDADGAGNGSNLSGQATADKLIAAIAAAGGPEYLYVEIAPPTAGGSGGEPGGNIRNGYLYNPDRVDYVFGSAALIQAPAYNGTRKPLVADFTFNGETVRLINVHFTSRGGSDPLYGANQPPANEGDAARVAQGEAVDAYINNALATNPALKLGVLGDFNGFYFEEGLEVIEDAGLTNLYTLLPVEERYSYLFEGNLQALDNFLVTGGLFNGGVEFDAVHINAEQRDDANRATDHDPSVARFFIEAPNAAPTDLVIDDNQVAENAPAGTVVGTLSADDIDQEDVLTYTLVDDAGGRFTVDALTGAVRTTQPLDHELAASYTILARVTDPDGAFTEKSLTILVTDVNEAPTGLAIDDNAIAENAPAGTLVGTLSAGDPEGDVLTYTLADDAGGLFTVDGATGAVRTTQPLNYELASSYTILASVSDPDGASTQKSLTIVVTDVNEAPVASADAVAVNEDATSANLWTLLLANDSDPDAGPRPTIQSVGTAGTLGSVVFDAATQTLRYVADHDSFDSLAPGATATDTFTYTVTDAGGLTSTATVSVTVTGIADGVRTDGGNGNDTVIGTPGEDHLTGGNGNDIVRGEAGHDWLEGNNGSDSLFGGAGNDVLLGGNGNDTLSGGTGRDLFVFGRGGGSDTVMDFDVSSDSILLLDGAEVKTAKVADVNGDGVADLTLAFSNGAGSVTLLGVSSFASVTFAGPEILGAHPAL